MDNESVAQRLDQLRRMSSNRVAEGVRSQSIQLRGYSEGISDRILTRWDTLDITGVSGISLTKKQQAAIEKKQLAERSLHERKEMKRFISAGGVHSMQKYATEDGATLYVCNYLDGTPLFMLDDEKLQLNVPRAAHLEKQAKVLAKREGVEFETADIKLPDDIRSVDFWPFNLPDRDDSALIKGATLLRDRGHTVAHTKEYVFRMDTVVDEYPF